MTSTVLSFPCIFALRILFGYIVFVAFMSNGFCKPLIDFTDLVIPISEKIQLPNTYLFQIEASNSMRRVENLPQSRRDESYALQDSFTGAINLSNGDKYLGQLKFGIPNGDGLLLFKEGDIYFGGFVNGRYEGDGAYFSSKGEKYIGQFQHNQKHGNGKTYFANGSVHEGRYQEDLIEGEGIFTSFYGNRFFGDFSVGNFSPKGIFVNKEGQKFYVRKILTTWVIDSKQSKKVTVPDTKFHIDFVKKPVSTHIAENCSKRLGIAFPADTLNEATWLQFKSCITE